MSSCIVAPEIILPDVSVDMSAWAVIACDQHTSDAKYWDKLEGVVGNKPSTLRLTLPEIYLDQPGCEDRIKKISQTMRDYKREGIFRKLPRGFILVERRTPYSPMRKGLVLSIDLEEYSYEQGARCAVRATEETILQRIPPRLKIREQAEIEFPHIMLLYDDPQNDVLGKIKIEDLNRVYDFDLNMGGGHVTGYFVSDYRPIIERFERLKKDGVLFMVGDGNHSLATAKASWEQIKKTLSKDEQATHPARYALVEAVNIYDPGIRFEGIHRIIKGIDGKNFLQRFPNGGDGIGAIYYGGKAEPIALPKDVAKAVRQTDEYIAEYLAVYGGSVDYIHGEAALLDLTLENADYVGIALPKMDKAQLFAQVLKYGSLPRKTFSMGESEEKRYYIEGKEIR